MANRGRGRKRMRQPKGNDPNSISAWTAQTVNHTKPRLTMGWAPMSLLFRPDEAFYLMEPFNLVHLTTILPL